MFQGLVLGRKGRAWLIKDKVVVNMLKESESQAGEMAQRLRALTDSSERA